MSTASSTRPKVLVLVGATGSGKTALLLELFGGRAQGRVSSRGEPKLPPAVIVSADSMQAYRGMDIGTAKPDSSLQSRLPHRLIDFLEPSEQYSVGDFVRRAEAECRDIAASGALPVIAGGTGFYVRNFLCGMPSAPPADPGLRASVARDLAERGVESLREELRAVDPVSASRIHPADRYRLTRALEIVRATGRALAEFASPDELRGDFEFLVLGLERSREELYARIDARVDAMFEAGLAAEFLALHRRGLGPESPGMKAIGYREFFELSPALFAAGPEEFSSRPELAGVRDLIKLDSRRYAKRQLTYFRSLPGISWIGPGPEALSALLSAFI